MAEARAGRALCARCARPGIACLCAWACAIANEIPLLILQHPLEQDHPKGSAKLLQLSLAQVRLQVGECFDPADLATWLQPRQAGPTVLL
ncbi:DTW domain-containing protein, partial [Ideonella sp.]|uniref:DTW domain-containing protein n=1 Tax=Ideonella sp. TaxID=1929293 RepID=UPI003BB5DD5E